MAYKVHIIRHHRAGVPCCSVFDEATGVVMSDLTEQQARQIAGKLSGELVFFDAPDAPVRQAS